MGKEAAIMLFLGMFYLSTCSLVASVNMSSIDELSLLAIKSNLNSDILVKNWSRDASFCTWIGVSCSRRHPRVTALDLSNMGLQGSIAREIGNLSFLTFLNMSNNSINGIIPGEIGNLNRLHVLDLGFNSLSDHIPQSLGLLRKLQHLRLSNNYLVGEIPTSLSACVQLKTVILTYNNLDGNIPVGFGNLSQLQSLYLGGNQLTGVIPSTIFNITSLLHIHVARNRISGSIPEDICSSQAATKLELLWLPNNQFEGGIPSTITRCRSLKMLSLVGNKFTGNLPNELRNMSAIRVVYLDNNGFTGTIPTSISNLSNLVIFSFSENSFQGIIPSEIGQLSSLTWLNLGFNKLNGEVPQSIFNLSRLQLLSLSSNNLSGNLPFSIDKGVPNLEQIYLSENHFHGKIPIAISNLSRLGKLVIGKNSFSGDIPITLGNLPQLRTLSLAFNQFSNNMSKPEQDFLSSLKNCKYLKFIQLSANPIAGVLPKSIGSSNLSASLELFMAYDCRIISPIPNEVGNLSNLILLGLAYNDLTGAIPESVGRLRNLQRLDMYGNKLQGSISPGVLCNLNNLYWLDLSENTLSGQLPECLGNLSSLRVIGLAYNAFNSNNIPSTLWSNGLVERMRFSNNFLDGSLSQEIGNMKSLIQLDLSGNQLIGEIPTTISLLQNLIILSLSNNKLDGPIIGSFSDLKALQHLDLSHNKLSGQIPKSLEALALLTYFDVSFNELSGEIPDRGPFANFSAEFFIGNKGLCGAPQFKVEECKRSKPTSSSKTKPLKYILPAIAMAIVAVLVLILVLRRRTRKLTTPSFSELPLGLARERISYLEIIRATNNLDVENLIGRGSFGTVYKAIFADTMVAAVKVFNLDVQGGLKSFDTECQIMRSIRHMNLVKVITSCSNLDFKALVMEYMPNGNLEKWIYSANCTLNIHQRLGVMIDVASALEYLHHGYTFPIVHCDLKPNNILLDGDMVAHVGDFGIAKLLTEEQRVQQTRTLGTIGYMAPEYGSEGLVSTMVDVYSYGILLMEILSRRKPTDEMFTGELTMRRWVSESFPNSATQIVDDELLLNGDDKSCGDRVENCLRSTIELALECTADMPEQRPCMKDVLSRIMKIKLSLSNRN